MTGLVGKTLKNRYRIEESIGRGGMADVYKVWDKTRADALAMKVLREDLAQDKIFLRRFEREAQTLAKLQHRSIVRFYGLEQDDLLVFLLMEYIEGTSLREEIFRAKEPFTNQRVLEVLRPVCAAMHYAHCMGIVHCDLKPGNILIDQHGELLVTDFGIARMIDASTATMVGLGTPAYMAPELVKGQDPMPQTDIYALGVILYEMFTGGERPFTGERAETTGSTAEKIRWEQMKLAPNPLTDYNPEISPAMQEIVIHCLAKKPDQRYEDMQAVYEEAEIVLKHKSGSIKKTEPKAEPVKEQAHEFHRVEKEEVNEDLQIPKQSVKKVKRNSLSRKKKTVPLFTHLDTQEGNIYDFDLCNDTIVLSMDKTISLGKINNKESFINMTAYKNCGQIKFFSGDDVVLFQRAMDLAILNIKPRKIIGTLDNKPYSIYQFDFLKNGKYCVGLDEYDNINVWDMKLFSRINNVSPLFLDSTMKILLLPPGDSLIKISANGFIHILSLPNFKSKARVGTGKILGFDNPDITISKTGELIAIWDEKLSIKIYNVAKFQVSLERNLPNTINTASFSPDERFLLTCDEEGNYLFWSLNPFSIKKQYSSNVSVDKVLFSSDGQYMITLCKGERLDYWKLNWEEVRN